MHVLPKVILANLLFLSMMLSGCKSEQVEMIEIKRQLNFNQGWQFMRQDIKDAANSKFDDSAWRTIDLPHDISLEDLPVQDQDHVGPFYKGVERGGDLGYLTGGVAWYRKPLVLATSDAGKQVYLHFDGIQTESEVFVNGISVHQNKHGYTPFNINISPYLKPTGEQNIIAIRAENKPASSRWFTGFGIYRDVSLSIVDPVHVNNWGLYITTPEVSRQQAKVKIKVELNNTDKQNQDIKLVAHVYAPNNKLLTSVAEQVAAKGGQTQQAEFDLSILTPELWDTETPNLYQVQVDVIRDGKVVDVYRETFGIRTIEFSADKGFLLNGRPVLLKGGNLHHDNGLIGAAVFKEAEYRRVKLMKESGFNSIRTSHNPASKHFLRAADELGVLIIEESFDMWELKKRKNDYHHHFNEHWQRDLTAMVLRDRNHPSIIMWSYGNEIQERTRPRGIEIAKQLVQLLKKLDPTRPTTQAINDFWDNPGMTWDKHTPAAFAVMDIAGYNYMPQKYGSDHEKYPERIAYGSESMPNQAFAYWQKVEQMPHVIGDYVWTGMDYIGESGIGISKFVKKRQNLHHPQPWPWFNAYCGDIDLIGNKKPQGLFRDVLWDVSELEILVHEPTPEGMFEQVYAWGWPQELATWNWPGQEGNTLSVNVYAKYPKVRLYVNNELKGEKAIDLSKGITATFEVPYQAGVLKAVGVKDGKEVAVKALTTTGSYTQLKLTAEQTELTTDRDQLVYVQVAALDKQGQLANKADTELRLKVSGQAQLIASGNASPFVQGSLQDNKFDLHRGQGLIILRLTGEPGDIDLSVTDGNGINQQVHLKVSS